MSQRINAVRSVFSVNFNSSMVENPGSGYVRSQSRQPGRAHLQAFNPSEPARTNAISPPPDRRMFRRRVERPVLQSPGFNRHNFQDFAPSSGITVKNPAADHLSSFMNETATTEQAAGLTSEYENLITETPVREETIPEYEESQETYVIDRPIYLLSQKYFGTHY